jgi:hypothetical protein
MGRRELIRSLGTKEPREARDRAPAVIAEFEATLTAARSGVAISGPLSLREIEALAAEWYREELAEWGDSPDQFGDLDICEELLLDQLERFEGDDDPRYESRVNLSSTDLADAARFLRAHRFPTDATSTSRLASAIFWMRLRLIDTLRRRLGGDWTPDTTLEGSPSVVPREEPENSPKVTFQTLLNAWAAESGTTGKALYDRERTAVNLAQHLGHDDAARVTADDVVAWKEARLKAGRSTKTVANDIGELRPVWTWAKRNRKLAFAENPFSGVAPKTKKRGRGPRGPFTEAKAAAILEAARKETEAVLRWLPWIACYTGARIGEIMQSDVADVQRHGTDGPWFLHIHQTGEKPDAQNTSERADGAPAPGTDRRRFSTLRSEPASWAAISKCAP